VDQFTGTIKKEKVMSNLIPAEKGTRAIVFRKDKSGELMLRKINVVGWRIDERNVLVPCAPFQMFDFEYEIIGVEYPDGTAISGREVFESSEKMITALKRYAKR
jgi:hypothetical protein